MILINLLPEELRYKDLKRIHLPLKKITIGIAASVLLMTIYQLFLFAQIRMEYGTLDKQWKQLAVKSGEADALEKELGDTIMAEVDFYDALVDPPLEIARILNIVSDQIPKTVWLTELKFDRKKNKDFELLLVGISTSDESSSKLIDIQNFANSLKVEMEPLTPVPINPALKNPIKVAVTTSNQKYDETTEVMQFTAILKAETPAAVKK